MATITVSCPNSNALQGTVAVEVEILVTDALGATATQNYQLVVSETATNLAPSVTSTPTYYANAGTVYHYDIAQVMLQFPESDPKSS